MSARALRYYEEQGLLHPVRRGNGYREYEERAVRTVHQVQVLLSAGLGTTVIAEILPCLADEGRMRAPVCPELLDGLAGERARITASIDALLAARGILDALMATDTVPFADKLATLDRS